MVTRQLEGGHSHALVSDDCAALKTMPMMALRSLPPPGHVPLHERQRVGERGGGGVADVGVGRRRDMPVLMALRMRLL